MEKGIIENESQIEIYTEGQFELNDKFAQSLQQQMSALNETVNFITKVNKDFREMYKHVQVIGARAEEAIDKAEEAIAEAKESTIRSNLAVEKLEHSVFLTDAESDEMYVTITERSTAIAMKLDSNTYFPNIDDFGKIVGKIRMGLWSIVKKRFGVSKYIKIKHVQYEEAINFSLALDARDYLKYKSKRHRTFK